MGPEGTIELIVGPMFSGKTQELLSRVDREVRAGRPAVLVRFRGDTRFVGDADAIATHAGARQASAPGAGGVAPIRVASVDALGEVDAAEPVVGVDEGQFYPDLVDRCDRWAREGRRVIVAALDGDFARRPFGQVCDLLPRSESVVKLQGLCSRCRRRPSAFSRRLGTSVAVVEIGAGESYHGVCRGCYGP